MSLGLTQIDSEVYLYLAIEGPKRGKDVAEVLNLYRQQLGRSLKRLHSKGMVTSTFERPGLFSAISLERVIDFLIEDKREQARALQASRDELLSVWRSIKRGSSKG